MLKNYFRIAYRNLLKNKVFSLVNIFGLAIGMSACFFIFLYVHFEQSYDRFHHNAARLYRVPLTFTGSLANSGTMASNHPSLGPALKAEFPEVENYTRVALASLFHNTSMLSYTQAGKTQTFDEEKAYFADASFFPLFSFPFIEGPASSPMSPKIRT